jgi:hypothetical protein
MSLRSSRPYRNFCFLLRLPKATVCGSYWQCQTSLYQNGHSVFRSQFRKPSASSSLFATFDRLRFLIFRGSEGSVSMEFIWWPWWTLVRYPENLERTRSCDFGRDISRMDPPIVKTYWWKSWTCWVLFKSNFSISFSERQILRCCPPIEDHGFMLQHPKNG